MAEKICGELGVVSGGSVTGPELDALDEKAFSATAARSTVFARVSPPEQKARLVATLRTHGRAVASSVTA